LDGENEDGERFLEGAIRVATTWMANPMECHHDQMRGIPLYPQRCPSHRSWFERKVKVYELAHSLNYGIPSADADTWPASRGRKFPTISPAKKETNPVTAASHPTSASACSWSTRALNGNRLTDFADLTKLEEH
jgi:hypothetical protein